MDTKTNIKNLPAGEYVTECMYSDSHAYQVVARTAKTLTVREVLVEQDPEWLAKKEFYPGGFCGHTANQHEQTWIFRAISEDTKKLHWSNKRRRWQHKGTGFIEGVASEFYDYNF